MTGDGAVTALLDAYEETDRTNPVRPTRPCLTHANFLTKDAIERSAKLGVMLDAGQYALEALRRPTRLAIKQLGLAVAEQLV